MRLLVFGLLFNLIGCGVFSKKDQSGSTDPDSSGDISEWKNTLVKSCTASEAFGGDAGEEKMLDEKVLVEMLGGNRTIDSSVFTGTPRYPTVERVTTLKSSTQVDGATVDSKDSRTELSDGTCRVYDKGELVYETRLIESIPVVASGYLLKEISGMMAADSGNDQHFESSFTRALFAQNGMQQMGVDTTLTHEKVAHKFSDSIDSAQIPTFFPIGPDSSVGVQLAGYGVPLLSAAWPYVSGVENRKQLESASTVSFILHSKWNAASDGESIQVSKVTLQKNATEQGFKHILTSVEAMDFESFSPEKYDSCVKARNDRYEVDSIGILGGISPAMDEATQPCSVLVRNPLAEQSASKVIRSIVSDRLREVQPHRNAQYNGWLNGFGEILVYLETTDQGAEAFGAPAGPLNTAQQVVSDVSDTCELKVDKLCKNIAKDFLSAPFYDVKHETSVVRSVAETLIPLGAILGKSARELSADYSLDPNEYGAQLEFAKLLSEDDLEKLKSLLTASDSNSFGDHFQTYRLHRFLQNQFVIPSLQAEVDSLVAVRESDLEKYPEESFYDQSFSDLAEFFYEGTWEVASLESAVAIANGIDWDDFCSGKDTAAGRISCHGSDKFSTGGILNPAHKGRYDLRLPDYREAFHSLQEDYVFVSWKLRDRFFDPVWGKCSNEKFDSKMDELIKSVKALLKNQDFTMRSDLERAVEDSLEDCN